MGKAKQTFNNIIFLLKPAIKYGKAFLLLLFLSQVIPTLANSLVSVALPKVAIDGLLRGDPAGRIILDVGLLLLVQLAVGTMTSLLSYSTNIKQAEFSMLFTKLILRQAIATDYRFLDKPEYYAKYQLTYQQFSSGAQLIFRNLINALSSVLTCAAMFAVIATLSPWVVVIVVVGTIIQVLVSLRLVKLNMQAARETTEKSRGINYGSRMLQERQFAADMKVSSMGTYVLAWVDKYTRWVQEIMAHYVRPQLVISLFGSVFNHLTTWGTIAYVVWGISNGKIGSIGDYAALIAASTTLSGQLRNMFNVVTNTAQVSEQAEQAREFFDLPNVIEPSHGETPPKTPMSLELRDVSFAYPESAFNIKHLNLKIAPGEKVGIVGENGAGKSTLVKLLLRLYDTDDGEILFNGRSIREWDVHELRKRVGIAFQDSNLYALTLRENLQYYNPEADDERRLKALRTVGLNRLDNLEKSVSREFMEDGIMLSGGETQRLALARLLMDDFGLIILDEPSSALDPLAEAEITKLMFNVNNTTTIMVAHRLSTIRDADCIYLISNGEVAERGTHAELMKKEGKYAEMFRKQAENYTR